MYYTQKQNRERIVLVRLAYEYDAVYYRAYFRLYLHTWPSLQSCYMKRL
jgi:hypothetical protein